MTLKHKKILMVSYTSYMQKLYQTLPREVAIQSGAEVKILVPPYWKELWSGGKAPLEKTSDPAYDTSIGDIVFTGNLHFAVFRNTLAGLIKTFQPDIIDLEDEPFNAGSYQMLWYRKRFAPQSKVVLHASQHQFKHYPPPFNWMERYVLKRAEAILVRNEMARQVLLQKGYAGKLKVVTHGVDISVFKPLDLAEKRRQLNPENKPVCGFIGALEPHKGVIHLLEAVTGLNCRTIIVGDGSEKSRLQKAAAEMDADVLFLPPASHSEVAELMNCMDVFVLPSLTRPNWIEKFGRVLIEAMACGCAMLGSDCGEIPNVIGNGGLIFREGDSADLRKKLSQLLNDPQLRQTLAENGKARVEQQYTWQAVAAETLDVYQQLLGNN